jgi:hypothetical protein
MIRPWGRKIESGSRAKIDLLGKRHQQRKIMNRTKTLFLVAFVTTVFFASCGQQGGASHD